MIVAVIVGGRPISKLTPLTRKRHPAPTAAITLVMSPCLVPELPSYLHIGVSLSAVTV